MQFFDPKFFFFKINFDIPKTVLNKSFVGRIVKTSVNPELISVTSLNEKLREGQFSIIDLEIRPFDSIVLPNDLILFANRDDKTLSLCNNNFKVIKKIDKIDDKPFYPESIAFNGQNKIYFTNRNSHEVIMTDLSLNKIKSVGSIGSLNNQFNDPCGICFVNQTLYICDSKNKRIQVLSGELEHKRSISLDYEPWLIKGSNNLICIETNDGKGINFYDLNDNFSLIYNYSHGWGKISMINSCFYECCAKKSRIYCYNENAELVEEIPIDRFDNIVSNSWDGYLFFFKNMLLMLCYNKRKLIHFN